MMGADVRGIPILKIKALNAERVHTPGATMAPQPSGRSHG
jgi:hypothetical protein